MLLPFWNSDIYVDIASWFPFGKDYYLTSVNKFYDEYDLKKISEGCLDFGSEFYFMSSPLTGCIGNFTRDSLFKQRQDAGLNLGFLMMLGYSPEIEKLLCGVIAPPEFAENLTAGITKCSLWENGRLIGRSDVIVIVSDDPFFDCTEYLAVLDVVLSEFKTIIKTSDLSYYAEKFGYDRFSILWENEKPYDSKINQVLSELKYESSREIVGGPSSIDFPSFMGISVAITQK